MIETSTVNRTKTERDYSYFSFPLIRKAFLDSKTCIRGSRFTIFQVLFRVMHSCSRSIRGFQKSIFSGDVAALYDVGTASGLRDIAEFSDSFCFRIRSEIWRGEVILSLVSDKSRFMSVLPSILISWFTMAKSMLLLNPAPSFRVSTVLVEQKVLLSFEYSSNVRLRNTATVSDSIYQILYPFLCQEFPIIIPSRDRGSSFFNSVFGVTYQHLNQNTRS